MADLHQNRLGRDVALPLVGLLVADADGGLEVNGVFVDTPTFLAPALDSSVGTVRGGDGPLRMEYPGALYSDPERSHAAQRACQAIRSTAALWEGAAGWSEVLDEAPLNPSLTDDLARGWLETTLADERGPLRHLAQVCYLPREHITYEDVRVATGRARRVSRSATRFLAVHSEDWAFTDGESIRPRRVLSSLPFEDLDLYENRIAVDTARLLADVIRRRMADVEGARLALDRILRLAEGVGGSHTVLQRVGALIGKARSVRAYVSASPVEVEEAGQGLLDELSGHAATVRSLDRAPLLRTPRTQGGVDTRADLGGEAIMTNLLRENPQYRAVGEFWRALRQYRGDLERTEPASLARYQALCHAYDALCLGVVAHALDNLGFAPRGAPSDVLGGAPARFEGRRGALRLRYSVGDGIGVAFGASRLRFAPSPSVLDEAMAAGVRAVAAGGPGETAALLCLGHPDLFDGATSGGDLVAPPTWYPDVRGVAPVVTAVVSPDDPFSVEAVARIVQAWFCVRAWSAYPFPVEGVPRSPCPGGLPDWLTADGGAVSLASRPSSQDVEAFLSTVGDVSPHNREEVRRSLAAAEDALSALLVCPTCDTPGAALAARGRGTFWCTCVRGASCSEWGLRLDGGGRRVAVLSPPAVRSRLGGWGARGAFGRDLVSPVEVVEDGDACTPRR